MPRPSGISDVGLGRYRMEQDKSVCMNGLKKVKAHEKRKWARIWDETGHETRGRSIQGGHAREDKGEMGG
eukprot:595462-Pyramimonas_sp.AAC.1